MEKKKIIKSQRSIKSFEKVYDYNHLCTHGNLSISPTDKNVINKNVFREPALKCNIT